MTLLSILIGMKKMKRCKRHVEENLGKGRVEEREGRKEFSTAESGEYEKRLKDNFYLIFYWMLHHLINMFFIVYHIFIYSYIHIIIIIKNNTKWYGKDVNSNLSMKLKKWQKEIRNTSEVKLDIFVVEEAEAVILVLFRPVVIGFC